MKFVLLSLVAAAAAINYDGYKVFRVPATGDSSVAKINHAIESLGLDTWQKPFKAGAFSDIVVAPHQLDAFETLMKDRGAQVMHENLGDSIAKEGNFQTYAAGSPNSTWFNSYHSYSDHLTWMNDLAKEYPSNAEVVTSGQSGDGNAITGVHFWGKAKGKPAIVFHGTVHAREWIATMVNEYILYSLLSGYGSDNQITSYLDKYDFYIFPVVNPDGFLRTQNGDRMWRKNTQPNRGSRCDGTDLNRNWPYKWDGQGSSTNPCADTYRGSSAGSSPENKALTTFLSNVAKSQGVKLYIDWHSYAQLFMSPYSWTCSGLPPRNDEYVSLARGAVNAIQAVHGTRFKYGPICTTIYPAAGSSVDWTTDIIKADYSYAIELRDTGNYGFVLPPDQIRPSGEESFAGIKYLLDNMR